MNRSRIWPSAFVICFVIGILFILSVVEGLGFTPSAFAAHKWEMGQDPGAGTTARFIIKDALGVGAIRLSISDTGTLEVGPVGSGRLVVTPAGNVGIGTTSPVSGMLEVQGGSGTAVYGNSTTGIGCIGVKGNGATGVSGNSGWSSGYGVVGSGTGTNGYGVWGRATNTGGTGVYGEGLTWGGYFLGKGYFSDNVGIGTTAPGAKLEVTPTVTSNADLKGMKSGLVYNGGSAMANYYAHYIAAPTGGSSGLITNKYALVTEPNAGNVGIGTTAPGYKLEVNADIAAKGGGGTGAGSYLGLFKGNGSLPGYASDSYPTLKTDFSSIYFSAGGAYSGYLSYSGTNPEFGLMNPSTVASVKLNAGNGTSSYPACLTLAGSKIYDSYDGILHVDCYPGGKTYLGGGTVTIPNLSASGYVGATTAGTLFVFVPSDIRLKKNIVGIAEQLNVLESLKKLRGVYYNWNTSIEKAKIMGEQREMGMIAQEVEPVIPEVVRTDTDSYKSLNYEKLTAFLIEVCKAQQKEIEEQKKENDLQRKDIDTLKEEIKSLKSISH